MTDETRTPEQNEEDFEIVLLAVAAIAAVLLGYRNRDRIKKWFNELTGKFTA